MQDSLLVTLIQPDTFWENPVANRAELEEIIMAYDQPNDLFILPETFTTGFTSNAGQFAEPMNFNTHRWMKQMAAQTKAAICGSFLIKEGAAIFNRFLFVRPNGETSFYDKKHLFSIGGERDQFTAGRESVIIEYKGWKIKPQICYDLRFPVWARNKNLEYDLLIYSANWPAARQDVWNVLLKARAIENQSYVLGVNRVGEDANKVSYIGGSQVINAKGQELAYLQNTPQISTFSLNLEELKSFRNTFPVYLDADNFGLL